MISPVPAATRSPLDPVAPAAHGAPQWLPDIATDHDESLAGKPLVHEVVTRGNGWANGYRYDVRTYGFDHVSRLPGGASGFAAVQGGFDDAVSAAIRLLSQMRTERRNADMVMGIVEGKGGQLYLTPLGNEPRSEPYQHFEYKGMSTDHATWEKAILLPYRTFYMERWTARNQAVLGAVGISRRGPAIMVDLRELAGRGRAEGRRLTS